MQTLSGSNCSVMISERDVQALLNWYKALGVDVLFSPVLNALRDDGGSTFSRSTLSCSDKFDTESVVPSEPSDGSDFNELCNEIAQLDCPLKRTARNTVICDGNISAKVMLIGEAPGYDEDVQGKPFVGQSGILLNKMLASIDLKRDEVFITNTVFWRPPGNRNPAQDEISLCLPFVKRLIKLVHPCVIMLLGSVATHAILDTMQPISKLRGRVTDFMGIKTIPTYHPAYLLRNPSQKKQAYEDLLLLKKILNDGNF